MFWQVVWLFREHLRLEFCQHVILCKGILVADYNANRSHLALGYQPPRGLYCPNRRNGRAAGPCRSVRSLMFWSVTQ